MLPIAATQPPGEATRLDSFRGALAGELLVRLGLADADSALAEALDRWELSLFQNEPFRSEQLRAALRRAARGDVAAAGCRPARDGARRALGAARRSWPSSPAGEPATPAVADAARRALVETLRHGDRPALLRELDEALLGVRERRPLRVAA